MEQDLADCGNGNVLVVARRADEAEQALFVRILHQPAKEQMALAWAGLFASRCIGELAPIERHERMERGLVVGGSESARRAGVPEGECEDCLLAANVSSGRCVGRAQRECVRVEAVVRVECSR